MMPTAGLCLLKFVVLILITPTEYQKVANRKGTCDIKNKGCGEFVVPKHEVGEFTCILNSANCHYVCTLECPKQGDRSMMTISDIRHEKDIHVCTNKDVWKRKDTPKGFCVANLIVKEVELNLHSRNIMEVNKLINTLLNTSYVYLIMSSFYERADVALPGFHKFMTDLWEREVKTSRDLISYVNKRGGFLSFMDIPRPSSQEMLIMNISSHPGLAGLEASLKVTREVNAHALELYSHVIKKKSSDPHLKYYLQDGIISHKTNTIKKLADLIRQLQNFAEEDYVIGEYIMDIELSGGKV